MILYTIRMSYLDVYNEKLELATNAIIAECKQRITDNWDKMFDMWLSCEADWEFPHVYEKHMKKYFDKYVTKDVNNQICFAAINLLFAINSFMKYYKDADLEDVIEYVDYFLTEQFEDFDNWCEEIWSTMYDEAPENAHERADN